jgi:hypothetical protein
VEEVEAIVYADELLSRDAAFDPDALHDLPQAIASVARSSFPPLNTPHARTLTFSLSLLSSIEPNHGVGTERCVAGKMGAREPFACLVRSPACLLPGARS